jgi:hypothetical protein
VLVGRPPPRVALHCAVRIHDYIIASGDVREPLAMIYLLAIFVPPLGLLLNGQLLAALFNFALLVLCAVFGLFFHVLLLVPSLHAVIAVYLKQEERRHREIVQAIERRGVPPGWGR